MSFRISSSVYPTARRAAILAIGNPVALLASALERETRGFISITTTSSVPRLNANCTFDPPVCTPTARIAAIAWSRSTRYCLSVSLCWGAPPAGPAERERGADDERQADLVHRRPRLHQGLRDRAPGHAQAGAGHGLPEARPVLGAVDRLIVGADQLDSVSLERAVLVQRL